MTTVLVVGTPRGRADTFWWLDRFGQKHAITKLVFGDSFNHHGPRGVDGEAEAWALMRRVPYHVELADRRLRGVRRWLDLEERLLNHVGPEDWALGLPDQSCTLQVVRFLDHAKARGAACFLCPVRRMA